MSSISASTDQAQRTQKILMQPIYLIFKYLQNKTPVQIWLYENPKMKLEGKIIGFDEFMNLVLDEAVELIDSQRTSLGRLLLKGENICLIRQIDSVSAMETASSS